MQITYTNKDELGVLEVETHKFTCEASQLGLKPGEWPTQIETNLGNSMPFLVLRREERSGDLLWVDYMQANGCTFLRIYND